jgi:hypothetical protein
MQQLVAAARNRSEVYDPIFIKDGALPANTTFAVVKFRVSVSFSANFADSVGLVLTNPSGDVVLSLRKNGTTPGDEVGTITISSAGGFTFSGSAVRFARNDYLVLTTPADTKGLKDLTVSLAGSP